MQPVNGYNPVAYPIINQRLGQSEQSEQSEAVQYYPYTGYPQQQQQQQQQQQPVTIIYQEQSDLLSSNNYQYACNQAIWEDPDSWWCCGNYCGYGDTRVCVPNPQYYGRDPRMSNPNQTGCPTASPCFRNVANFAHPRFQCLAAAIVFFILIALMISAVGFIY